MEEPEMEESEMEEPEMDEGSKNITMNPSIIDESLIETEEEEGRGRGRKLTKIYT